MSISKSVLKLFNTNESRDATFKEDVDVFIHNNVENCSINAEKLFLCVSGTYYSYRSPSMGNAVLDMPIDKIEIKEVIDDLPFLAAAMEAIKTTKIAVELGNPKNEKGLLNI